MSVLEWANTEGYEICNRAEQGPTFFNARGSSFIDLTMSKNVTVENWEVEEEESLSGHCYIKYTVKMLEKVGGANRKVYDFANTDWERFKNKLREMTDSKLSDADNNERRAEVLQEICRKACQRHIRRREIDEHENDWFDDELGRKRTKTRRLRRAWQRNKTDATRTEYIECRNEYNKLIKKNKEDSVQRKIDEITEQKPWHKLWKFITKGRNITPKKNYRKEDGTYTQTDDETNRYLLEKYFPEDRREDDNEVRRDKRQGLHIRKRRRRGRNMHGRDSRDHR